MTRTMNTIRSKGSCAPLSCFRSGAPPSAEAKASRARPTSSAASISRRTTSACSGGTARARRTGRFPPRRGAQAEGTDADLRHERGMYGDEFSPTGLYVEEGQGTLARSTPRRSLARPAKFRIFTRSRTVFFTSGKTAGVMTTDAWLASPPKAVFATQSGPMLVIDGKIHPAFIEGSTDLKPATASGLRSDQGAFRNHRGPRELSQFRALLPRQARLRQRAIPRRGSGAGTLFAGARADRRARPRRLWADHRRGQSAIAGSAV